jgi:hypothetical protein
MATIMNNHESHKSSRKYKSEIRANTALDTPKNQVPRRNKPTLRPLDTSKKMESVPEKTQTLRHTKDGIRCGGHILLDTPKLESGAEDTYS